MRKTSKDKWLGVSLTMREVEKKTAKSRATIYRLMAREDLPFPPPKSGGKGHRNLWDEREVHYWMMRESMRLNTRA